MNHREILRNALRQVLAEKWQSFDGLTDQIERAAGLVKQLGGLQAPEITELDRARISTMIGDQVQLGIERGDFDFVFARHQKPRIVEIGGFSIAKLDLAPDDVVVVKVPGQISADGRAQLEAIARQVFGPPRKVLVLDGDHDLQIVHEVKS